MLCWSKPAWHAPPFHTHPRGVHAPSVACCAHTNALSSAGSSRLEMKACEAGLAAHAPSCHRHPATSLHAVSDMLAHAFCRGGGGHEDDELPMPAVSPHTADNKRPSSTHVCFLSAHEQRSFAMSGGRQQPCHARSTRRCATPSNACVVHKGRCTYSPALWQQLLKSRVHKCEKPHCLCTSESLPYTRTYRGRTSLRLHQLPRRRLYKISTGKYKYKHEEQGRFATEQKGAFVASRSYPGCRAGRGAGRAAPPGHPPRV